MYQNNQNSSNPNTAGFNNKNLAIEKMNEQDKIAQILKNTKSQGNIKKKQNKFIMTPLVKPKSLQSGYSARSVASFSNDGQSPEKGNKAKLSKSQSISHYSNNQTSSSVRNKYKNEQEKTAKMDDMLENMYNTYTLTTGANYIPQPTNIKTSAQADNRVNNEAVKKAIADNNRSRIKNPLLCRTTLEDYKLDGNTVNRRDFQPFEVEKEEIKPKKRDIKHKMLVKHSSNTMSYPNQGPLGTFHVKTPQFYPHSIPFNGTSAYSNSFMNTFKEHKNSTKFVPYTTRFTASRSPIVETAPSYFKTTNDVAYNNNIQAKNNITKTVICENPSQDKYQPTPTPMIHFMTNNRFDQQGASTFLPDKKVPAAQGLNYNSIFS